MPSETRTPNTVQSIGGAPNAWSSPTNVTASDNLRAVAFADNSQSFGNMDRLVGTNFGFTIPVSATISQIRTTIEYHVDGTAQGQFRYRLNGLGTGPIDLLDAMSAATDVTILTSTITTGFTPANINNSTFGFEFRARKREAVGDFFRIDYMAITVTYTSPQGIDVRSSEYDHEIRSAALTQRHFTKPASSEYDHEVRSVKFTQRINPASSEYDTEIRSVLIYDAQQRPQSSEYDFEIKSVVINTTNQFIDATSSEYDHEISSIALTQTHVVAPASSEYDHEIAIVGQQSFVTDVKTSEYDFEIRSVFITPGTIHTTDVRSSEYDHEIRSVLWGDSVLRPDSAEFDFEIKPPFLTFGIILDPTEGAEFDFEIASVTTRRFLRDVTRDTRGILVGQGPREYTVTFEERVHEPLQRTDQQLQ